MAKHAQVLRADPERYPNLKRNPALERALRIQQALAQGRPRDEAVQLAEEAMGPRAPAMMRSRPEPRRKPSKPAAKAARRGRAAA